MAIRARHRYSIAAALGPLVRPELCVCHTIQIDVSPLPVISMRFYHVARVGSCQKLLPMLALVHGTALCPQISVVPGLPFYLTHMCRLRRGATTVFVASSVMFRFLPLYLLSRA